VFSGETPSVLYFKNQMPLWAHSSAGGQATLSVVGVLRGPCGGEVNMHSMFFMGTSDKVRLVSGRCRVDFLVILFLGVELFRFC